MPLKIEPNAAATGKGKGDKNMRTFFGSLGTLVAGVAIAGGCVAGCGSPSSSAASAAQPGNAGLKPGQGTFQIRGSVTEFGPNGQSIALQGTVDGLALTATGTGNGLSGGGFAGQGNYCGSLGLVGSSASGTLGGVPFSVTLNGCSAGSNGVLTGRYTGTWGSRAVNVALTTDEGSNGFSGTTLSGTVGTQQLNGSVPAISPASGAPGQTAQISGTITVS
jgi:hypothetical protein